MKILIALPVYNEDIVLERNVLQILNFCQENLSADECQLVICDNASNDRTGEIGKKLSDQYPKIKYTRIEQKGKGIAWKTAFTNYDSAVYVFMDIDLAMDLSGLKLLIDGIKEGADMSIASRYCENSKVARSWSREFISKTFRLITKILLGTKVNDLQCGFKAINHEIKKNILPLTREIGFFLDTELIYLAGKNGYQIKEVPVDWSEFRDQERKSSVNIFQTSWELFTSLLKLKFRKY